jgi:hypothetical protein
MDSHLSTIDGPPAAMTFAPMLDIPQGGPTSSQFVLKPKGGQLVMRTATARTRNSKSSPRTASNKSAPNLGTPIAATPAPQAALWKLVTVGPPQDIVLTTVNLYFKYDNIFHTEDFNFPVPELSDNAKRAAAYYALFVNHFFIYAMDELSVVTQNLVFSV